MMTINLRHDSFMHWKCSIPYWDKKVRRRNHSKLYTRGNKTVNHHATIPETSFLVYQHFIHSLVFFLFQSCGIISWWTNDLISQMRGCLRYIEVLHFYLCNDEKLFFKIVSLGLWIQLFSNIFSVSLSGHSLMTR